MQALYTRAQLEGQSLSTLKAIAADLGVSCVGDKRKKESWVLTLLGCSNFETEVEVSEWCPEKSREGTRVYQVSADERKWLSEEVIFQVPSLGWRYKTAHDISEERFVRLDDAITAYRQHLTTRDLGREERAKRCVVVNRLGDYFEVKSFSSGQTYCVNIKAPYASERCDCRDAYHKKNKCKHQIAVERYLARIPTNNADQLLSDFLWVGTIHELQEYLSRHFDNVEKAITSGEARRFLEQREIEFEAEFEAASW